MRVRLSIGNTIDVRATYRRIEVGRYPTAVPNPEGVLGQLSRYAPTDNLFDTVMV